MYLFVLLFAALDGFAASLQIEFPRSFRGGGKYVIRAVASDREGNVYVAGSTEAFDLPLKNAAQARNSGSSITVSRDGGRTWEPRGFVPDLPFTSVKAPVAHPQDSRILLARGTHGLYRSTDGGDTWTTVIGATTLADTRVFPIGNILFHPADPRVVYAAGSGAVLRSADSGVRWTLLPVGLDEGYCCLGSSIALDPFQPSRLIYNTISKSFLSDNAGASWRLLPVDGNRALFDPSRKGTVYLQQYDVMARSLDSGGTWNFLPLNARLMDWMVADASTPGRLYAGVTNSGIVRSDNYGDTWTTGLGPGGAVSALAIHPRDSNRLLAVSGAGAFTSADGARTWQPLPISRPLWDARFDPGTPDVIYAAGPPTADGFLTKFNAAGEIVYSTYLGGHGVDAIAAVIVEDSGDVLVAGETTSLDFPNVTTRIGSGTGAFVGRMDGQGRPRAVTVFAGRDVVALAIGPDGSWHVGTVSGVIKLSPAADRIVYEESTPGRLTSLTVDRDGNAVAVGSQIAANAFRGMVVKWTGSGTPIYARALPILPEKLALGSDGDLWIAGEANVSDNPPLGDSAYQRTIRTNCPHDSGGLFTRPDIQRLGWMTDIYVGRLDADGDLTSGTYFGGSCRDWVTDLAIAPDGSFWIAGESYSDPIAPQLAPLFAPPAFAYSRAFVAHLAKDGTGVLDAGYLDYGSLGLVAAAADGAIVAWNSPIANRLSVNEAERQGHVLKLSASIEMSDFEVIAVTDAFTQTASAIAPSEIVRVSLRASPRRGKSTLGWLRKAALHRNWPVSRWSSTDYEQLC